MSFRFSILFLFVSFVAFSQESSQKLILKGQVIQTSNNLPLSGVRIHLKHSKKHQKSDEKGLFAFEDIETGNSELVFYKEDFGTIHQKLTIFKDTLIVVYMDSLSYELSEIQVEAKGSGVSDMEKLKTVEGTAIYEGKKTEVIVMKNMNANLASNNARQVFAKVPGLNIWESDCAGIQLGIGARGLSPNRTANFNTRQNGYDISADALGYPESYYTPPMESIDRIEVVRGAASLQYGTQFGGLLNFKMKDGAAKPIEVVSRQTLGAYKFFNSFNSIGGTKGKFKYYAFYQHKQGDCWRAYSSFNLDMGYGTVTYQATEKLAIKADFTRMTYLSQMAGGLTDNQFNTDPTQVNRKRNWFRVNWNLFALSADYKFSARTHLNTRFFGIYSGRDALGNLNRITNPDDPKLNRNLLMDTYFNIGNETRLLHRYMIGKRAQVFVVGFRLYRGQTIRKQGEGSAGDKPEFQYLNPDSLENSDFTFPGVNYSAFAEHAFFLSEKLSITPGVRFEYINTQSKGYYANRVTDGAGNVLINDQIQETRNQGRHFLLFGLGLGYKYKEFLEIYANASQNYRAITFSDIRVVNPNYAVDPKIKDENGYTIDLGARGTFKNVLQYDMSLYYMRYNDRIGEVLKEGKAPTYNPYRYRTNVADSRTYGVEVFAEMDVWKLLKKNPKFGTPVFGSFSANDARYINTQDKAIRNKHIELVPSFLARYGAGVKWKQLQVNYQFSYIGEQYTDASNATKDPYAVYGLIPEYYVMDISAKYTYKFATLETGVSNIDDNLYFTRRAEGYPGPGIIPSSGRTWYLTLGAKF